MIYFSFVIYFLHPALQQPIYFQCQKVWRKNKCMAVAAKRSCWSNPENSRDCDTPWRSSKEQTSQVEWSELEWSGVNQRGCLCCCCGTLTVAAWQNAPHTYKTKRIRTCMYAEFVYVSLCVSGTPSSAFLDENSLK